MVVEADSTIRYMSPSVERVLGHEAAELEGTKLTVLIHPDDRAGVLQFLTSGGREGDAHPGLTEFRMRHQRRLLAARRDPADEPAARRERQGHRAEHP